MSVLEIITAFNKIPFRERQKKSKEYEEALRKHLRREIQITNILNQWLRGEEDLETEPFEEDDNCNNDEEWSAKDELMRMYGAETEEELNDWQETNPIYND